MDLLRNAAAFAPAPLGIVDILIVEDRIAWIGPTGTEPAPAFGINERDLGGSRVIPGLIDGHVHITGGGGEDGAKSRVPPLSLPAITGGGVTTVVGVLGTDDTTRDTASLLAATRALNEQGITAFCHTGGYHIPPTTLTGSVRGDIVNVDRIIGVGEVAISDHRSSQPTTHELLRLAADAHVAGLLTAKAGIVHLHVGDGAAGLAPVRQALENSELPPRVFNPTHVNRRHALFEEAVELARGGSVIDVTSFPVTNGDDELTAADALLQYWDQGLPPDRITVSSDGGGCLPEFDADGRVTRYDIGEPMSLAASLGSLLKAGCPLESVLAPFTSNVAQLLRLHRKGHLRPGADADLVVLDETGSVTDVMALGEWHMRDGEMKIGGTFQ